MSNEEKLRDLADQICRLDIPFDREAIVKIVRDHVSAIPAGPRIPMVIRLIEPGYASVNTVSSFASEMHIDEDLVAQRIEGLRLTVEPPDILVCWMSYLQNVGTVEEPRYVLAWPLAALSQML